MKSVSRTTTVAAAPQAIFELLADPARHPELDGSGTVREAVGPSRLHEGARFGMKMRMGLPYRITNTVVEFEENRVIAWRHFGRHIWRWQLEAIEGGTRVTETFRWDTSLAPWALEAAGIPSRNARGVEATLRRLEERFGHLESAA